MGIERFFNSLKDKFNIIKSYDNKLIDINYLFFDFNSIIHTESQKVINILNIILKNILQNKRDDEKKYLNLIYENENTLSDIHNIEEFLKIYNSNKLNNLIIKNITNFTNSIILKLKNLKLIYISIDGVPSKAKIVEQKKRRFMGEFDSNARDIILEKHRKNLNVNINGFNKYIFLKNKLFWSKSNISPGSSFMILLNKHLEDYFSKSKINVIIDNFTNKNEAEKKIVDYINNHKNKVNGKISIFSPDADMILLTLILKNNNIKKSIIRINTERSDLFDEQKLDIIDVDYLEFEILKYFNSNTNTKNIINDIVFIFTFFGDDFLSKIESINVKNDIEIILNVYKKLSDKKQFIIQNKNNQFEINFTNFVKLLQLFTEIEPMMMKNVYFSKTYKNYNFLIKDINNKLKKYKYQQINQDNILKFINDYNNKIKNIPDLGVKKIFLLKFSNSLNNKKIDLDIMDDYDIEIYKYENMLDEYVNILNKEYEVKIGNPKYKSNESKTLYYKDFFNGNKINDICQLYLMGLQWIVDYYFNDVCYINWYYKYHKAPLISDLFTYLSKMKNNFFKKCKDSLIKDNIDSSELSPLEHFLYVTYFDKDLNQLSYLNEYKNKDKIKNLIKYLQKNKVKLYPNFKNITKDIILNNKKNIDCRESIFLSKCILKVIDESNMISEIDIKNITRKFITLDSQI